jgi:uncharacterized protein
MKFKLITVDDCQNLKKYFENQTYQLSTYSLFSIIVWSNKQIKTYFATENDSLIIYNEPDHEPGGRHLILPLSLKETPSPEYLYTLAKEIGLNKYCFVPETYLEHNDRDSIGLYFTVTEQPEYEDYIYLTEDLIQLKGYKYAKQRNLIHQFDKVYLSKGRVGIETIAPDNVKDCMDFLLKWCIQHKCDLDGNESLACEKMATINALNNLDRLESKGILVRIDRVVSAFGICSRLTENMGTLNFEKAFSHIKGLYQFLDNECAKRLFSSYRYINKESDMNLPNLAQSKSSYNPIMKLKSYCLTMR